jgi:hypothetical protein
MSRLTSGEGNTADKQGKPTDPVRPHEEREQPMSDDDFTKIGVWIAQR